MFFYHVFLKLWIVNWCEINTPITQITIIWRKLHFLLELSIVPERLRIRLGRFLLHDQHEDVENVAPSHVSHNPGTHLQKPKFWVKGSTLFFVSRYLDLWFILESKMLLTFLIWPMLSIRRRAPKTSSSRTSTTE